LHHRLRCSPADSVVAGVKVGGWVKGENLDFFWLEATSGGSSRSSATSSFPVCMTLSDPVISFHLFEVCLGILKVSTCQQLVRPIPYISVQYPELENDSLNPNDDSDVGGGYMEREMS
jgi:hypothetical protein